MGRGDDVGVDVRNVSYCMRVVRENRETIKPIVLLSIKSKNYCAIEVVCANNTVYPRETL